MYFGYNDGSTTRYGLYIAGGQGSGTSNFDLAVANKFYVMSGGNVLIGTTTDDTINKLQVTGSGYFSTKVGIGVASPSYALGISSTTTGGTRIDLVPKSTDFAFFQITNTAGTTYFGTDNSTAGVFSNGNYSMNFYNSYSSNINFYSNATLRLTIASTGAATLSNLAGTGSRAVLADASGTLSAPVSDISVKQNIKTIGYGLNEISKMNPVWFNFIDEYKNFGEGRQNGNIAQEMEAIIPEAVFTTPSTGKMGINYDKLHAVYIKAIQELKAEIDALKNN